MMRAVPTLASGVPYLFAYQARQGLPKRVLAWSVEQLVIAAEVRLTSRLQRQSD